MKILFFKKKGYTLAAAFECLTVPLSSGINIYDKSLILVFIVLIGGFWGAIWEKNKLPPTQISTYYRFSSGII